MAEDLSVMARKAVYYCASIFGAGLLLGMVGILVIILETLLRMSSIYADWWRLMPASYWPALGTSILTYIAGAVFGGTLAKNSANASNTMRTPEIGWASSSIYAFSLMILFSGVNGYILAVSPELGVSFPVVPAVAAIVGAAILMVGYHVYRSKMVVSKIIGGALFVVSAVLIYLIMRPQTLSTFIGSSIPVPVEAGPLQSEGIIETVTVLCASACAIVFAVPQTRRRRGQAVLGLVLSSLCIIFACGVIYYNFSSLPLLADFLSLALQNLPSFIVLFIGVLVLGIGGIAILIGASIVAIVSAKQLVAETPSTVDEDVVDETEEKFCQQCGTKIPKTVKYCRKCGKKQT